MGERLEEFKQKLEKIDKKLSNAGVKVLGWEEVDGKDFGFSLDFSEHDKVFKDKIAKLETKNENLVKLLNEIQLEKAHIDCDLYDAKKLIEELEKKELIELPFEPIEVAKMLIESKHEYETNKFDRAIFGKGDTDISERYNIDELEQIAEHLLVYCKHNKEQQCE